MSTPESLEILLVEDNPRDAELTVRALKKRRVANEVAWVKDGAEALEFLFGHLDALDGAVLKRPKVILLDLKLPKLNGLEVLRALKSNATSRTIPVIVLTSSREGSDLELAYELGVNSYIVKPVNFENFSDAVAQLGMYWLLLNESAMSSRSGSPADR